MSLATRSLEGKSHLMEEPLALSYTEGDGIMLLEVEREQQAIPQVLIISQFSGRPLYLLSQSLLIRRGKPTGAPWAIPFPQSGKAIGKKPANPILDSSGRVSIETCRFVRAGSLEHVEHHVEPMEVSPFTGSRYLVLNGGDKCFCIWNRYSFHWKRLRIGLLPAYPKI
ncbi:MAG: hypothetical protein XD68_1206 [Synergistales bacterium 54_24]|jgi:hypothetical protein|nr:MAG: hypothetical protein XD68_1206 [Synergistales bacterium 54_24]MDI3499787.1 hypothetical protein [Synergistaceae bacterium]